MHFVSASCEGEACCFITDQGKFTKGGKLIKWLVKRCGRPAQHKLGEEIGADDPNPDRHNLTAYVCCEHFERVVGAAGGCTPMETEVSLDLEADGRKVNLNVGDLPPEEAGRRILYLEQALRRKREEGK